MNSYFGPVVRLADYAEIVPRIFRIVRFFRGSGLIFPDSTPSMKP